MQQGGRYPSSEFLFPAVLAVLFAVGMCAAHFVVLSVSDEILPWQRELYPTANTLPGKLVYGTLMAALGFGSLWRLARPRSGSIGGLLSWTVALAVFLAFVIGEPVSLPFAFGFWATVTAWLYVGRNRHLIEPSCKSLGRVFFQPISIVLVVLAIAFCLTLPLITPVVASSGAQLASLNNHYSGFMPGFELATGAREAPIGVLNYGLGPALLVGGLHRLFSPLSLDLIRLSLPIKFYQFVALFFVVITLRTLNRKNWFALSALVLCSTPTFSSVSDAIFYPNLSGVRYLSILFMLYLLARSSPPVILGIASALSLLYARETGIVAAIGAVTFVVVVRYAPGVGLKSLMRPLLKYLIGISAFVPGYYLSGCLQSSDNGALASSFVSDFVSGFCGISTLPSPFSVLLFFFASFGVYQGFSRAGYGRARKLDAYQAGVGSMMLVWLFYYINRMHPYNLWFQSALLVMMFAPRFDFSLVRLLRRGSICARSSIIVSTALIVGLSAEHSTASLGDIRDLYYRVYAVQGLRGNVTDLSVPEPLHSEVVSRLRTLRAISPRSEYLVVSNLSTDVRALGFNQGLPWYDLFSDILTRSTLHKAHDWIDMHGPRFILLEDPSGAVAQDAVPQTAQLQALVRSLSVYREVATHDGWITFERIQ